MITEYDLRSLSKQYEQPSKLDIKIGVKPKGTLCTSKKRKSFLISDLFYKLVM